MSFKDFLKEAKNIPDYKRIDPNGNGNIIDVAFQMGKKAHDGQTRKFDGKPYFTHPLRVAQLVKKFGGNDNMYAAALLHDTLEDTNLTYEDIVKNTNKSVADLVLQLTSNKSDMEEMGSKAEYLTKKMNAMSKDALTIKLLDRLDNVSDFKTAGAKFVAKYKPQTEEILSKLKTSDSTHLKIIGEIKKIIEQF
jgi:GTP pyrophosphokinase